MNLVFLGKELYLYIIRVKPATCSTYLGIISLCLFVSIGVFGFTYIYNKPTGNKKAFCILNKNNVTAQFYFGYFSLFVLLFMGFDLTNAIDLATFWVIFLILAVVYCNNNLFYINPTINLLGVRIFNVKVESNESTHEFCVITKVDISIGTSYLFFVSPYEFTMCEKLNDGNDI